MRHSPSRHQPGTDLNALINYFVDLCLLRRAPQDLPASNALFSVLFVANVLVGALLVVGEKLGPALALAESLAEVLLMLVVLRLGLGWRAHPGRFLQSAGAVMGSSTLLGLVALPLLGLGGPGGGGLAGGLLLLVLVFWSLVVLGHILRHAFELTLGQGVIVALFYTLLSFQLIALFFPVG